MVTTDIRWNLQVNQFYNFAGKAFNFLTHLANGLSRHVFVVVILVLFVLPLVMITVARPYHIPTPSMVPTLEVGDIVFVTKYSYGIRPFTWFERRAFGARLSLGAKTPKRGDIVVVRNPARENDQPDALVIKRVIGLPGDDIRLIAGQLEIRTQPVTLDLIGPATSQSDPNLARGVGGWYLRETLPQGLPGDAKRPSSYIITDQGQFRDDTFGPFTVPQGALFLMGDNRDSSADSRTRALGVVPMDNLIGRAQFVAFSLQSDGGGNSNNRFPLRLDRFFRPLQ